MCGGCNPRAGVDCQRPTTSTVPSKASLKAKKKGKDKKGDRKKRDK
jgi:hypothetical protein